MRVDFAHEALLALDEGGDVRAPGAAVTVALCGHWEHEPPCPLAEHHTTAERRDGGSGGEVLLRVRFSAAPADEAEVRARIVAALAAGRLDGPDGVTTRWGLREARPVAPEAT